MSLPRDALLRVSVPTVTCVQRLILKSNDGVRCMENHVLFEKSHSTAVYFVHTKITVFFDALQTFLTSLSLSPLIFLIVLSISVCFFSFYFTSLFLSLSLPLSLSLSLSIYIYIYIYIYIWEIY